MISKVTSNDNLVQVGRATELTQLINKNPATLGNVVSPITMCATIEAIIGTVWMDSKDIGAVRLVVQSLGIWPEV